jgi:hypothetical protein
VVARWLVAFVCVAACDQTWGLVHVKDHPDALGDGNGDGSGDATDADCPGYDITLAAFPDSRYSFQRNGAPWTSAQDTCMSHGQGALHTHLVVIQDDSERTGLYSALLAKSVTVSVWIGLSDRRTEDQFLWVTNEPVGMPPRTTPPWPPNQPDDDMGLQDCVRMKAPSETTYGGFFDDNQCFLSLAYVCECDAYPTVTANY